MSTQEIKRRTVRVEEKYLTEDRMESLKIYIRKCAEAEGLSAPEKCEVFVREWAAHKARMNEEV